MRFKPIGKLTDPNEAAPSLAGAISPDVHPPDSIDQWVPGSWPDLNIGAMTIIAMAPPVHRDFASTAHSKIALVLKADFRPG